MYIYFSSCNVFENGYIYINYIYRQQVDKLKTSSAIKVLDGKTRAVTT